MDGVYPGNVDTRKSYPQEISFIDSITNHINKNRNNYLQLEKVKLDSADRTVFIDGNEPVLVVLNNFDKEGVHEKVEYYFHNNLLIFAEVTWTNDKTNILVDHEQTYFYNEHLFHWLRYTDVLSKHEMKAVDPTSEEFINYANSFAKEFPKLKERILK